MIIPSKHSGYQAGIRLYPGGSGGGGSGGGGIFGGSPPSPNLGYNQQGQLTPVNQLGPGFSNGMFGRFDNTPYSGHQFAPTPQTPPSGYRPTGDQQFYQPVYQQQYQNYSMGNPMSISQYGQQPSYGGGYGGGMGGYGGYGGMGGYGGGYDGGFMPQMQSSFNYQQPQQTMARPNYGPSQPIVSRSAQMRGTPNVMRRAEGGITSLLDEDE